VRNVSDKFVEKSKSDILRSIPPFSRKSCRLSDGVEKCSKVRQATEGNLIQRMRLAC